MTDWSTWKVVDLRAEAKNRGLPTKGVKAELVQRLTEADAADSQPDDATNEEKAAADEVDPAGDEVAEEEAVDADVPTEEAPDADGTDAIGQAESGAVAKTASLEPTVEDANTAQPVQSAEPGLPTPDPTSGTAIDLQKRKRRSSTPPPSVKRVRQEEERQAEDREDVVDFETGDISASPEQSPQNGVADEKANEGNDTARETAMEGVIPSSVPVVADAAEASELATSSSLAQDKTGQLGSIAESPKSPLSQQAQVSPLNHSGEDDSAKRAAAGASEQPWDESQPGDGPSAPTSVHPPTTALYIRDLMRPLRSEMVEQYILDLITPTGQEPDPSLIQDFYLDQIRTHAFVVLQSISAAQRVRSTLHNQVWPNESNRKPLFVDFVPSDQVKDWIDKEETASRGSSRRWEVVYDEEGSSVLAVHREIGSERKPSFSRPPPTGPAAAGPVYPGIEAAPRGPRGRGARPPLENPGTLQTQAHPRLSYTPLDEDVARRRIENMRSFYSRDPPADLGKDYHRFTFENADAFVDRGREVFIGIRPPHRQKEHEEKLRRDRLGLPGSSSAADSRRDDYRPPPRPSVTDEDRFSRHNDTRRPNWPPRNRGYRGDRGSGRFRGEDPYRYRPGY